MSRVCAVSGKKVLFGNKVSHSNRKSRTRFNPNLQRCSFPSEILGTSVQLRLTTRGIRTVEKRGGIDAFLLKAKVAELDLELRALKRRVTSAKAKKKAA
jgi:large subunit ribosomal protein L28